MLSAIEYNRFPKRFFTTSSIIFMIIAQVIQKDGKCGCFGG